MKRNKKSQAANSNRVRIAPVGLRFSKAQAAMEYLMTYGWAILIVLIALGALFYLGVFTPKAQNSASIEAPFSYLDMLFVENADTTNLGLIRIGAGGAISSIDNALTAGTNDRCNTVVWQGGSATPGTENTIELSNCDSLLEGDQVSGSVDIVYTRIGGFSHTATLRYTAVVEGA